MKVKFRIEPRNQIIFDIANEYNCIMKIVNANCSLETIEKIAAESAEHFDKIKAIVNKQKIEYENYIIDLHGDYEHKISTLEDYYEKKIKALEAHIESLTDNIEDYMY